MTSLSVGHEGSLWMGDIADYMDEDFIKGAFQAMDESVVTVKLIKNKYTGMCAGYCFVHFKDDQTALRVMHKLNGKMIPNSQPPTRFMLNHSNAGKTGQEREFSLWVGDLDKSVDDSQLYLAFASRYSTIRAARVVTDKSTGTSRGYAFVRFGSQEEHKDALTHMNGFSGMANKPIRVSVAVPRKPVTSSGAPTAGAPGAAGAASDYSAYYEQYWYNYHAWQNYGSYDNSGYQGYGYDPQAAATGAVTAIPAAAVAAAPAVAAAAPAAAAVASTPAAAPAAAPAAVEAVANPAVAETNADDDMVVEHDVPVDLERQNQEYVLRNEEFWDALDASRWLQPDTLNPALEMFIKT